MKDFGLDKALVQEFQTSKKGENKHWYGFRKMFWSYLKKLNVPFYDACCPEANGSTEDLEFFPMRYNASASVIERFDGTGWVDLSNDTLSVTSLESAAISVDTITENSAGSQISLLKNTIQKRTAAAINATATATADQIKGGLITSTSAAAVALTLPTATDLATSIGAVQGTSVDFMVDNSAGANTVTVTVNTGITAVTAVITGGATLTVASGAVGTFRIFFTSATVAKIARLI